LRILHLTDPHLFADTAGDLRGTVTHSSLRAVLDHYHDSDWRADLIVVTGDLIHDDSRRAYDHFCEILGSIGAPVYCVPGNHDVFDKDYYDHLNARNPFALPDRLPVPEPGRIFFVDVALAF